MEKPKALPTPVCCWKVSEVGEACTNPPTCSVKDPHEDIQWYFCDGHYQLACAIAQNIEVVTALFGEPDEMEGTVEGAPDSPIID